MSKKNLISKDFKDSGIFISKTQILYIFLYIIHIPRIMKKKVSTILKSTVHIEIFTAD